MEADKVRDFILKVCDGMEGVDGGCPICASKVAMAFIDHFPESEKIVRDAYLAAQGGELSEDIC